MKNERCKLILIGEYRNATLETVLYGEDETLPWDYLLRRSSRKFSLSCSTIESRKLHCLALLYEERRRRTVILTYS